VIERRANPNKIKDWDQYPYVFRCEVPLCFYTVSAKTLGDAESVSCIHLQDGNKHMPQQSSVSLFKLMFNELDLHIDEFMKIQQNTDDQIATALRTAELKGHIAGLASCIVLWMKPIFADIDAVKREGNKRYKARQRGDETYQTAGVDYKWMPGESLPGKAVVAPSQIAGTQTPGSDYRPAEEITLTEEQTARVKKMGKAGFTVQQIATQAKLPSSMIQTILGA
jgi:hypothetical protein